MQEPSGERIESTQFHQTRRTAAVAVTAAAVPTTVAAQAEKPSKKVAAGGIPGNSLVEIDVIAVL